MLWGLLIHNFLNLQKAWLCIDVRDKGSYINLEVLISNPRYDISKGSSFSKPLDNHFYLNLFWPKILAKIWILILKDQFL